jgi:hypothetical protein
LLAGYLRRTVLAKVAHQNAAVLSLLVAGLLIAFALFMIPLGGIMAIAGGLLAWHLHCTVLPKVNIDQRTQVPLQQASQ